MMTEQQSDLTKVSRDMMTEIIKELIPATQPEPKPKLNGAAPPTNAVPEDWIAKVEAEPFYSIETEVELLKTALDKISPDDKRGDGSFQHGASSLACVLVGASLGDKAKEVVRTWSMKSDKYDETDFDKTWNSYNRNKKGYKGKRLTVASLHSFVNTQNNKVYLGDIGNAIRFAEMYRGRLKFVRDSSVKLEYDDVVGWVKAKSEAPIKAAEAVIKKMAEEAAKNFAVNPDDGNATKQLSEVRRTTKKTAIDAMIELSKAQDGMSIDLNECDSDNFLIGVPNGVLDLDRGILLPPDPNRYVTKRINAVFDPKADCPRYKQFLKEAHPDPAERAFLNRINGYILCGSVGEQIFLFFLGTGANGKTVWIELTKEMLGDYAAKIQTEMLMSQFRSSQGASPDLIRLQGKRFIYANETTEGRFLDDARVKDLTGGDTITGRVLYASEHISFTPTHKLIIAGNHAPIITDDSEGLWRRMVLMRWGQEFKGDKCDPDLPNKLAREASGILNYWLEGFQDWRKNGLNVPPSLKQSTNVYRSDQDLFAQFVEECCITGPGESCETQELKRQYFGWCEENHTKPMSGHRFGRKLTERGFKIAENKRTRLGINTKEALRFGFPD